MKARKLNATRRGVTFVDINQKLKTWADHMNDGLFRCKKKPFSPVVFTVLFQQTMTHTYPYTSTATQSSCWNMLHTYAKLALHIHRVHIYRLNLRRMFNRSEDTPFDVRQVGNGETKVVGNVDTNPWRR